MYFATQVAYNRAAQEKHMTAIRRLVILLAPILAGLAPARQLAAQAPAKPELPPVPAGLPYTPEHFWSLDYPGKPPPVAPSSAGFAPRRRFTSARAFCMAWRLCSCVKSVSGSLRKNSRWCCGAVMD